MLHHLNRSKLQSDQTFFPHFFPIPFLGRQKFLLFLMDKWFDRLSENRSTQSYDSVDFLFSSDFFRSFDHFCPLQLYDKLRRFQMCINLNAYFSTEFQINQLINQTVWLKYLSEHYRSFSSTEKDFFLRDLQTNGLEIYCSIL